MPEGNHAAGEGAERLGAARSGATAGSDGSVAYLAETRKWPGRGGLSRPDVACVEHDREFGRRNKPRRALSAEALRDVTQLRKECASLVAVARVAACKSRSASCHRCATRRRNEGRGGSAGLVWRAAVLAPGGLLVVTASFAHGGLARGQALGATTLQLICKLKC